VDHRLSILWLLLVAVCLRAQNAILLNHANIIDCISDQPIRDAGILVENGRIISLTTKVEKLPVGSLAIDLGGRWILPGLIDAHVHIRNLEGARAVLATGVTTMRMMGLEHYVDVGMRELHRNGAKDLPEVIASGYALPVRPDVPSFEGFILDFPQLASAPRLGMAGIEELRRRVDANLQHGVNAIKILADLPPYTDQSLGPVVGGIPTKPPPQGQQTFTEQEIAAIVNEARKEGLPVAAHTSVDESAAAAVRAGVRSIEHGTVLSDSTLDLMKQHGTYLVPTLSVRDFVLGTALGQKMSPAVKKASAEMQVRQHDSALRAWRKGIPLVAGTDMRENLLPSFSVSTEVAEFVKIGVPPMEAIKAATSRAAECLRISNRTGSIRTGYEADLIVVDGDPLVDIGALKKVVLVINDGQIAVNKLSN
jgi:imidazolonepropionase-like amidohydrolase